MQEFDSKNRILAVGDGSNDINMISSANVGVGIIGDHSISSAKFADYGVGNFGQVINLVFVFGRESYRKNCNVVLYNFLKNFMITLPQIWLGFFNFFAG